MESTKFTQLLGRREFAFLPHAPRNGRTFGELTSGIHNIEVQAKISGSTESQTGRPD
jgi:hypothetical protein